MNIKFLATCRRDVDWFFLYYERHFPEGLVNAKEAYRRTFLLLQENPLVGRQIPEHNLRLFPILRTPFAIVYRATRTEIRVAHIWDMRAKRDTQF